MRYRRSVIKGGTYFFTIHLAESSCSLLANKIETLRNVMMKVKKNHPYQIDAMVVLPDHLHALWTMPEDDNDYSKQKINRGEQISTSRIKK